MDLTEMAPSKTPNAPRGTVKGTAYHNIIKFTIRAAPLPEDIIHFILDNVANLKQLQDERRMGHPLSRADASDIGDDEGDVRGDITRKPSVRLDEFWDVLAKTCEAAGGDWKDVTERIWSFGPQRAGGCLLIDARNKPSQSYVLQSLCNAKLTSGVLQIEA
jgi:ribosome assembly protein 1